MQVPLVKHDLFHVLVGPIRDREHRHARTDGPDQTEYFRYLDLCRRLRMAASDKYQPRADVAKFLNRRLNGPNEHRLVALSHKPIGEFDPTVDIRFYRSFNFLGSPETRVVRDRK